MVKGFYSFSTNVGIKNKSLDLTIIYCDRPCSVAGVFTQNKFAGIAVKLSQENIKTGKARALIVNSKNANVATGQKGIDDAKKILSILANELDINSNEIQIASTGVIGEMLPIDKIIHNIKGIKQKLTIADFNKSAQAIMTTDNYHKIFSKKVDDVKIVGIAKGVGMIEPNMATMLTYFFTDADIDQVILDSILKKVVNKTFNCMSIDADTSTSDSCVIFANGISGGVNLEKFENSLYEIAHSLMIEILKDGEGVTKIIKVNVLGAIDEKQATEVGKKITNSLLIKTAINGCSPNWGRIIMAVGNCDRIDDTKVKVSINDIDVYPSDYKNNNELITKMKENKQIDINVYLGLGNTKKILWGCDLSTEYVKLNSNYIT